MVQMGVVSSLTVFNSLAFASCIFTENIYNGVNDVNDGYAIRTSGSPLRVRDSCFF